MNYVPHITSDVLSTMSLDDWEKHGLRLDSDHARIQFLSALEFITKINITRDMRIADVGAGPGHQSFVFKRLGADIVAIDYKKPIYDDIEWIRPEEAGRMKGEYDLVWSHHCLEHIPDPVGALVSWNSMLKPGGMFCLTVPECAMVISTGHLNSYSLPLMMYHLAIAGFDTSHKCFSKKRSHLRAFVTKAKKYDPSIRLVTSLSELAKIGLFSPSVTKAIENTGRFSVEDMHLNWFGESKQPELNARLTYDFVLDSIWKKK